MTEGELRDWMFMHSQRDAWLLTHEPENCGVVPVGPMRLTQAQVKIDADPGRHWYIVHATQTGSNPPWLRLLPSLQTSPSQVRCPRCGSRALKGRRTFVYPLSRGQRWLIGLSIVVALGGLSVGVAVVNVRPVLVAVVLAGALAVAGLGRRKKVGVPIVVCFRCNGLIPLSSDEEPAARLDQHEELPSR